MCLDGPEDTLHWNLAELAEKAGTQTPARVIPSLLRGFSAPVILDAPLSDRPTGWCCWPMTAIRSTAGRPGAA